MDARETHDFVERLMREVWEPYAFDQVPRFYNPDVVGHHRGQTLNFDDVVNRLSSDHQRFSNSRCDIADIVAASDKFAIRFRYTATFNATGKTVSTEVAEFWLLANLAFDYRAP